MIKTKRYVSCVSYVLEVNQKILNNYHYNRRKNASHLNGNSAKSENLNRY